MKKFIFLTATLMMIMSCACRYGYATMTVINDTETKMTYKALIRDEQSGDATGDWIIKIIPPNKRPLNKEQSDTINHTWLEYDRPILFSLCWGFIDASGDYNVYDNTMDYIKVYDGENVSLRITSSSTPLVTRNKL